MAVTPARRLWTTLRFGFLYVESAVIVLAARLWQSFWPAFCILALFITVAALDGFGGLSRFWHYLLLGGFAAAMLWVLGARWHSFRFPRRSAVEHAMEQAAGITHRPLQALRDQSVVRATETLALWHEHQARMQSARANVKRARFQTSVPQQDPYYLRYIAGAFVVLALAFAGKDAPTRLAAAIQPGLPALARPAAAALDIWIAAPTYTQVAPVYLARAQNTSAKLAASASVPAGSVLKIRLSGQHRPPVIRLGDTRIAATSVGAKNFTAEIPLVASAPLTLRQGLKSLGRWQIDVLPDQPPAVQVISAAPAGNGGLKITWQGKDDYGIAKAVAVLTAEDAKGRGLLNGGDALIAMPLTVPPPPAAGQLQDGTYSYQADLSGHPMAGHPVTLEITATDATGQTARSQPISVTLPERKFESAAARSLVTERKRLLFFGDTPFVPRLVSDTLLDLVNTPEAYRGDRIVFLTLASAVRRINYDGDAESLRSVADMLWDIALRVEDGGVSEAARALQAALSSLSSALNDPAASKQQIKELLGEVQKRLAEYMQAMATETQARMQSGDMKPMPSDIAEKVMQKIDLQDFMRRLQDMANGDQRDGLRQMAEMLRNMTANLSPAEMARMQEAQQRAMQAMQELQSIVQDQQRLAEAAQSGGSDGEGAPSPSDMAEMAAAQDGLESRLGAMRSNLGALEGKMSGNLDTASQQMQAASNALRAGQGAAAVAAQRAALKALTDAQDQGLQQMADAMQSMMMLGMGGGQQAGGSGEGFDPLGRSQDGGKNIGGQIGIPSEGERRRVQEIQRELRDRYNDSDRSRSERDYLERLLDLFR